MNTRYTRFQLQLPVWVRTAFFAFGLLLLMSVLPVTPPSKRTIALSASLSPTQHENNNKNHSGRTLVKSGGSATNTPTGTPISAYTPNTPKDCPNLFLSAITTHSDSQCFTPGSYATDGSTTTSWGCHNAPCGAHSLYVDMLAPYDVTSLHIYHGDGTGHGCMYSMDEYYSDDGHYYVYFGNAQTPNGCTYGDNFTVTYGGDLGNHRWYRYDFTGIDCSSNGDVYIREIQACGVAGPTFTPTPTPACGQTPVTSQGDDTFSINVNPTCDIDADIKVRRFYGPIDVYGHILSAYLDKSVDHYAYLKMHVENVNPSDQITGNFQGVPFNLNMTTNLKDYSVQIPTSQLILPPKGTDGNMPPAALNHLVLTHSVSSGGSRTRITSISLTLAGMRPLIMESGSDQLNYDNGGVRYTAGGWDPNLWFTPVPFNQFVYELARDRQASIRQGGANLRLELTQTPIASIFGVSKINLISHSMGGLWGREYVKNMDQYNSVDKLIMLGPPNKGSVFANILGVAYNACLECLAHPSLCPGQDACTEFTGNYRNASPALQQLTTDYVQGYNNDNPLPAPCTQYIDQAAEIALPICGACGLADDTLVSVDSAQGEPSAYGATHLAPIPIPWTSITPVPHARLLTFPAVQTAVAPYYALSSNSYNRTGRNNVNCAGTPVAFQKPLTTPTPYIPILWPSSANTIQSGQVQTTTITVDDAYTASFMLAWFNPTSTLNFTLRDPAGQVITSTSNYPGSAYIPNLLGFGYTINNPQPGSWQAVVQAQSVPTNGVTYLLGGELMGGVQLNPSLSSQSVGVGRPVTITSTIMDPTPIAGAVISAAITLMTNGSYINTLPLSEQSGGIYQTVFTPTITGTYLINLSANGTNHQSHSFKRRTALQLQVASGAAFNGAFSEQAYPIGGSVYNSLMISATTAVTEAGQYRLNGHLTTPSGGEIASSMGLFTLTTGLKNLPLTFSGQDIGASGADGPYQLRDLLLKQVVQGQITDGELTVANLPLAYTTTTYTRSNWPRGNVIQTGPATMQAGDTNHNGLYEYLQVSVPINVLWSGVYSASVNLVAHDGSVAASANMTNTTFNTGANTLLLRFDGPQIRTRGLNGPYKVEDLSVWPQNHDSSVIPLVLDDAQPYQSRQFELPSEAVVWTTLVNVTATGNSIQKTGGVNATWDAGAVSTKAIQSGDGYVQATVDVTNTYRMFGLSNGDSNATHTDIDFAAYLSGSTLTVYQSGVNKGNFGTLLPGDTVRVIVEGGAVKYYLNSTPVYTSTIAPTYPLLLDTSIYSSGATVSNAYIAGFNLGTATYLTPTPTSTPLPNCQYVVWTNLVNTTATGSTLQKTGGADSTWDAGASSTTAIISGDGYVQTTVDVFGTYKLFGLSNGDSDVTQADVDFAIFIADNVLKVYENGVFRGDFGTVSVGDVLKVSVESNVVKYYRNGVLFYTSTRTPTYPLLLDTSINSSGANIINTLICGANLGPPPTSTPTPTCSGACHYLVQEPGAPSNGGTTSVGTQFTLDMIVNSGSNNIVTQQGYLTFTSALLQNVRATSTGCVLTSTVTADTAVFDAVLQNDVCNAPGPCVFRGTSVGAGSIGFTSGALSNPSATGTFRVAQIAFCAIAPGQATLHWQFSPPAPMERDTEIISDNSTIVNVPSCYRDYVINIIGTAPLTSLVGHVTWQGASAQPSTRQQQPITLTLKSASTEVNFTSQTTDASGFFTVSVTSLPAGTYSWRAKGPRFLANSGAVFIGVPQTNLEIGLMRVGDATNDNLVSALDFTLLKAAYGTSNDLRTDFNNDGVTTVSDFNLLKNNFATSGSPPIDPRPR